MSRILLLLILCANATSASVRFVPSCLPPARKGGSETVAVVIRPAPGSVAKTARVSLRTPPGVKAEPAAQNVTLAPGREQPAFFRLTFTSDNPGRTRVSALVDGREAGSVEIGEGYDLEAVRWKAKLDKDVAARQQGWMRPDFDDSAWPDRYLPTMWNDIGVTYLRARVFVPESWRGKEIRLKLRAVDDNDVCYLNGIEIGRTDGWDKQRNYLVDPKAVRYGEENLLCIAADNVAWGGGIYRSPSTFGIDVRSPRSEVRTSAGYAPAPEQIGKPLPLRRMRAQRGVLRYEDGGEVALWGVNYYPQSWYQFDNMKRLGVNMKKAIRDDLDDMKQMGVEVIRIHVFDREISDRAGNLIDNEHLDLLDYLISEGSARGIYFMFTPIAWWGGPNENPDSFSARTPKEFMFCDDVAVAAEANYLRNWLNHTNRYTGHRYKDEPAICALEVMNEPAYADYNTLIEPESSYYKYGDPNFLKPFKERMMKKWQAWCASHGIAEEKRFFPLFRYQVMSEYLETVYKAIRHTGATQPVAWGLFDTAGKEDLISAIADSRCEAVTTGTYAGDWNKVGDGWNYLPWAANEKLDARLSTKARLIYEFDGIKTFGSYLYPAFARKFRNLGAQICSMFQYDSSATAEWNTDWDAHYLNWLYTPGKAVSFLIGGRVFHDLPRGAAYPTVGTEQRFGKCAVSFDRNASIYCDDRSYIGSAPWSGWSPVRMPAKPTLVMSVGDSPYASYNGTGAYILRIDYIARNAVLTINPDAVVVGDPWHPKPDKSAVVLRREKHAFTLNLPGVSVQRVARCGDDPGSDGSTKMTEIEVTANTFEAGEGKYYVMW